jgi:O-antigen ligase
MVFSGKIELFNNTVERLGKAEDASSLTTGRSDLWKDYLEYILQNPLVVLCGKGVGAAILHGHAAHNTYIEMVYFLGLCGIAFLLATLVGLAKMLPRPFKRNMLNYGIIVTLLVMYFFLGQIFYFDFAFQIMLAIIVFKLNIGSSQWI